MRPGRIVSRGFFAGVLLAAGACGPGATPTGQSPMVTLNEQSLQTLRQDFNASADQTRVILLLSPT